MGAGCQSAEVGGSVNPRTAEAWVAAHLYCQSHAVPPILAQEAAKRYRVAMRKAVPAKPKVRLPRGVRAVSIPKLKKELDRVFSLFIRQRDSNEHGYGACVTCSYLAPWNSMDCGHYQPRQDMATRWDEKNCHLQCKSCNGFRGGEPEKMAVYIDAKYGSLTALALRTLARQPFRLSRAWMEMKITEYKRRIRE